MSIRYFLLSLIALIPGLICWCKTIDANDDVVVDNINHIGSSSKVTERKDIYHPMLEEGKTWKYVMRNEFFDKSFTIYQKIEGRTNINGTEYYCLNQYEGNDGNIEFAGTLAYLNEDLSTKKVTCLRNNDFNNIWTTRAFNYLNTSEEEVIYDFLTPLNMTATSAFYTGDYTETVYFGVDGVMRSGYTADNSISPLMMVEGLGWLSAAETYEDQKIYMGDLFGPEEPVSSQTAWNRYLYEISDSNGNILYKDMMAENLLAGETEIAFRTGCSIERHDNIIDIRSENGAIGSIRIFSATGTVIRDFQIDNDRFEINIEGYLPGVYFVTANDAILKFAVK